VEYQVVSTYSSDEDTAMSRRCSQIDRRCTLCQWTANGERTNDECETEGDAPRHERVPGFYSSKNVRKTEEKPENVRCILYKMVEKRLHQLAEIVGVGIYDGG